jgi:hypothetical protein
MNPILFRRFCLLFIILTTFASIPAAAAEPVRYALLVGINDYRYDNGKSFRDLQGSVNDIQAIKALLIGRYRFAESNIHTLKDRQAKRGAILSAFDRFLIQPSKTGDIAFFYFSGHGSKTVDRDGDETDGFDETLVPHDGRNPAGDIQDITDDEIYRLLQNLSDRGVHTVSIYDSCHSGSVSRSLLQARWIPADTRGNKPPVKNAVINSDDGFSTGLSGNLTNFTSLSASTAMENAYEVKIDGRAYGAFTLALTKSLARLPAGASYRDLQPYLNTFLTEIVVNQHPQMEGAIDRRVFETIPTQTSRAVTVERLNSRKVKLNAGKIGGVTKGSLFEIYRDRNTGSRKKAIIGNAEIETVALDTSTARLISGQISTASAKAVEIRHNFGDRRLMVWTDRSQHPAMLEVEKLLADWHTAKPARTAGQYDVRIYKRDRKIFLDLNDGTPVGAPVWSDDSAALITIKDRLAKLARYRAFVLLANKSSSLGLKLSVEQKPPDRSEWRTARSQTKSGETIIRTGNRIRFKVQNMSTHGQAFYVYVIYLGADYRIQVIYPMKHATDNLLKAGSSVATKDGEAKGLNRRDRIKVIATSRPVNIWGLQQAGVQRSVFQSPLERLLSDVFQNGRYIGDETVPIEDWQTASAVTITRGQPSP